jgi:predicted enzyme related to lactoylglutathione lyase
MSDVPRGRFVWYDLMTTDPSGATEFYKSVAGWGTDTWRGVEGDQPPYEMWMTEHGPIGGVMTLPDEAAAAGAPPHWLGYVATPDVDTTVDHAVRLGAALLVPGQDIPDVGRFAVLQDPTGAAFCIYTPSGDTPGHDGAAHVGEVSWHELMCDDYEAAFAFYAALFGWEKGEGMDMGPMGIYQIFERDGVQLGGMMNRPAEVPMSCWLYYVRVGDLDDALDRVRTRGGTVANGPMDVPGGDRVAQCVDPQGAAFALHEVSA